MRVAALTRGVTLDQATGAGRVWREVAPRLRRRVTLVERPSLRQPDVWLMPGEGLLPRRGVRGRPLVAVLHGAAWTTERDFWDHVPRAFAEPMIEHAEAILACAAIVVAPSEFTRRGLVEAYGAEVVTVPHGVDTRVFRPRGERRGGDPYVLFASDPAYPHKNLAALREAMESFPGHRLVVAGGNSAVGDGELAALMSGAAAFCLPSLFESFGLTALEAMACGAPVVVSNRGALPEVVGDAGLTCDPSPEAIAEALGRVLGDDTLARRLGEAGRARAQAMTWERTADGWTEALRAAASAA